jgi:hypothetical protein
MHERQVEQERRHPQIPPFHSPPHDVLEDWDSVSLENSANALCAVAVLFSFQEQFYSVLVPTSIADYHTCSYGRSRIGWSVLDRDLFSDREFDPGEHSQSAFVQFIPAALYQLHFALLRYNDTDRNIEFIAWPTSNLGIGLRPNNSFGSHTSP